MYRYEVDEGARLVTATFERDVSDADLFDYLAHMLANTKYSAGWRSFIDLSKAEAIHLTSAGIQRMRALPLYMEERLNGARAAILANDGSQGLEMARMYEKLGQGRGYRIAVFTDRESAMRWLDRDAK